MKVEEVFEYYRSLGLDVAKLTCGCAVKVDLYSAVYPALRKVESRLRAWGVSVGRREDADIFEAPAELWIARRVYRLPRPKVDVEDLRKICPRRALLFLQVYQRRASAEGLAELFLNLYGEIAKSGVKFHVGKGHTILTPFEGRELALFDFICFGEAAREGFAVANNDTLQIIDPTRLPHDKVNVAAMVNNALNDLFTLGVCEELELHPVYDGPGEEASKLRSAVFAYAGEVGVKAYDHGPVGAGTLLVGASAVGRLYRQPPTFYDRIEPGMKVLLHRPVGELSMINAYLAALLSDLFASMAEEKGLSLERLEKAKELATSTMAKPNFEVARVINEFLPEIGEEFDPKKHVAATVDFSGPGVLALREIADLAGVKFRVSKLPLLDSEVVTFAAESFLVPNATAGTNGAVAVIASTEVIEQIAHELHRRGYSPQVIGEVVEKGASGLEAPPSIAKLVVQPSLKQLITQVGA